MAFEKRNEFSKRVGSNKQEKIYNFHTNAMQKNGFLCILFATKRQVVVVNMIVLCAL